MQTPMEASAAQSPINHSPKNDISVSQQTMALLTQNGTNYTSNFVMRIENRVLNVVVLTQTVRSQAVLALGKLCLQVNNYFRFILLACI